MMYEICTVVNEYFSYYFFTFHINGAVRGGEGRGGEGRGGEGRGRERRGGEGD